MKVCLTTTGSALAVMCALHAGAAVAADYYISPTGDDGNNGRSLRTPFRTIGRCATLAVAGDNCNIEAGIYRETVAPAHSGAAGAPITFQAYVRNGVPDNAVVSGAEIVAGWHNVGGAIWQAKVPAYSVTGKTHYDAQLFVNGQPILMVRWPSAPASYLTRNFAVASNAGPNYLCDPNLAGVAAGHHFAGTLLHVLPGLEWWADTTKVVDSGVGGRCAPNEGYLTFTPLPSSDTNPKTGPGPVKAGDWYYLIGYATDLAAPGQFFYDPGAGSVNVWLPDGSSPNNAVMEWKQRADAFAVAGHPFVTIEGIHVFAADIVGDAASPGMVVNGVNGQWMSHSEDWRGFSGGSAPSDFGIAVVGDNSVVENSIVNGSSGHGVGAFGSHVTVVNNLITNAGYASGDGAGIYSGIYSRNQLKPAFNILENNTIAHVGAEGIGYNDNHLTIRHNNIWDQGILVLDVGGAVHQYGRYEHSLGGTEISYNWLHDAGGISEAEAVALVGGEASGVGIYLDFTNNSFVIHHNIVWNENFADMILNGAAPLHASRSPALGIYSNTFADPQGVVTVGISGDYPSPNKNMMGTVLRDNIIYAGRTGKWRNATVDHNLELIDPLFTDPAKGEFSLKAGSPAIGAGIPIHGITRSDDIGAVPFGTTMVPAGCNFSGC